jgi:2,4-dienoyl-CoA reductase (NADPH2)
LGGAFNGGIFLDLLPMGSSVYMEISKNKYKKLIEPSYIGKLRTRNRIIKTGAGTCYAKDGWVTPKYKAYYEALARGGVGLLIVEHCEVEYPLGAEFNNGTTLRLDEDRFIDSVKELVQLIHKHDCPTMVQFYHIGIWHDSKLSGMQAISSSSLAESEMPKPDVTWWKYEPCKTMTFTDIERVINCFVLAAERAKKAGFDGVEINGAGNHLINSFFSRIYNKRDDKYGIQSLENRSRFMVEIIQSIKKRLGQDFPITTIINGAEYGDPRGTTIEESKWFAKLIKAAGADAIQIRPFGYDQFKQMVWPESIFYPEPPHPFPKELDGSRHGAGPPAQLAHIALV